jgi:hypothetical protein
MAGNRNARRWSAESVLNLDSLVDVVTNTNGMLILLAVFTTVMAMGKTYEASYPMVRETDKVPVLFECRGNRILLVQKGGEFGEPYQPIFLGDAVALIPKDGEWGEDPQQASRPESQFRQTVAAVDPAQEYLVFLVRPDSFETFRGARDLIWESRAGVDIGWEPVAEDGVLAFGPSGRKLPPQ